jgi:transcriptional regulator with XRE-family HTH domain
MDRAEQAAEHAVQLRRALAQAGLNNGELAVALGVSIRTVVNWTSRSNPTLPSDRILEQLRTILPGYADQGDPVEVAVARAELAPFRRSKLLAMYQELLHEQSLEDKRLAQA